jgi:hypothetical protein
MKTKEMNWMTSPKMRRTTMPAKLLRLQEPKLIFGHRQEMEDPRDGLSLFGPYDPVQLASIRAAYVGTPEGIARFRRWVARIQRPVVNPRPTHDRPLYPGFEAVFGVKWNPVPVLELPIDPQNLTKILTIDDLHQRIYGTVSLFEEQILAALRSEEEKPDVWFVIVPDSVYQRCRPKSNVPPAERTSSGYYMKERDARQIVRDGLLPGFDEMEQQARPYAFVPDFRNQLKGRLLAAKVLTQVVRESTVAHEDFLKRNGKPKRDLSNLAADIAWNLTSALVYKAGAKPWKLGGVRRGVCYLGLVFKQDQNDPDPRSACSAAQMFLDSGDGVVFRGTKGLWYSPARGHYHLDRAAASAIVARAVTAYREKNGEPPRELFIHGRVRFNDEEWAGFQEGAGQGTNVVGVRINRGTDLRLFRQQSSMPILRGLAHTMTETKGILWTNGFVPRLNTSTAREVPRPLLVDICCGRAPLDVVLQDVMGLTKLNYNCCRFTDGLPVTLRFADAVGEILTSGPIPADAPLPFKHYI